MGQTHEQNNTRPLTGVALGIVYALGSPGCKSEQGITEIKLQDIAVVTGDFDQVEEFLTRNLVAHTPYEGFIFQSVYDEDADPDATALKVESLFTGTDESGDSEMINFQAVFVNSGSRGFGDVVYNGTETDNSLVTDNNALRHTEEFLDSGGTLIVSDWAYDLVEAVWPDEITFLGEDSGLDAAQVGTNLSVICDVTDDALATALGTDQLEVNFDFTYWAVMESAASGVDVYLSGDVTARTSAEEGDTSHEDVPLLVGFDVGGGRVIVSSFSWKAQNSQVTDTILLTLMDGLDPGNATDAGSAGE